MVGIMMVVLTVVVVVFLVIFIVVLVWVGLVMVIAVLVVRHVCRFFFVDGLVGWWDRSLWIWVISFVVGLFSCHYTVASSSLAGAVCCTDYDVEDACDDAFFSSDVVCVDDTSSPG